ncbi:MAG: CHRD domain-containing protein [Pseudomonadota bacterium]
MKIRNIVGGIAAVVTLAACSNDSTNGAPGPEAEEIATIRGIASEALPSAVLPSQSLPSATLPSASLPSLSLPSAELDETPSIMALRTLAVTLEASQEVTDAPLNAGNEQLTAVGSVTVDENTLAFTARVTAQGLDSDDTITMVHIHSGFAGENGGVLIGLQPTADPLVFEASGSIHDFADIPGNDLATFLRGGWYLNLHTASNPTGQLRGQMFTNDVDVVRMALEGQQENPAVVNANGVSGTAYVTFDASRELIVVNSRVAGFTPFLDAPIGPVHLHAGFAGENGPVVLPLQPVGQSETVYRGTEADISGNLDFGVLSAGGIYLNIHSAANPSGELRGQVVPRGTDAVRMQLQGAQENPVVANADGISGVSYATFNAADGNIVINTAVEGFTPFLDAPIGPVHLHSAFAGENGPVVLPLQPVNGSDTVYRGTEADATSTIDFGLLADGGMYINVHSAENPSGELRGQLVPRGIDVARMQLEGQQENPAVANATGISGVSYATLNPDENRIVINAAVEGFTPFLDAPIGPVHLHSGFAGQNGPVLLPLNAVDGSETQYRGTEADAIATLNFDVIAQGGAYINIHSAANPTGELRGQLIPRDVDAVRMQLQGQQQNPAVVNAAGISGVAYATYNPSAQQIVLNADVEGFIPALNAAIGPVHLHAGFAGENGPVLLPLQPVDGSDTQYRGSEADLIADLDFDALGNGGTYINIHSAANPSGELRGQLTPRGVQATRAELQGAQENPVVNNADGISGVAYATVNTETESLVITTAVEGFEPFLDAPIGPVHLHAGNAGINGPVLLPLQPVDGSTTRYRGTDADAIAALDFQQILEGGTYINVHSADNASGEVRGQIVTSQGLVLRAEMDGSQVEPPNNSTGTGVGYVTLLDRDSGNFSSTVRVSGIDPTNVSVNTTNTNGADLLVNRLAADAETAGLFISEPLVAPNIDDILNGQYSFIAQESSN